MTEMQPGFPPEELLNTIEVPLNESDFNGITQVNFRGEQYTLKGIMNGMASIYETGKDPNNMTVVPLSEIIPIKSAENKE